MTKDYENLIDFLKLWLDWVDHGAPKHPWFSRGDSLCFNAINYGIQKGVYVKTELMDQLQKDFGYKFSYPFCTYEEFWDDYRSHSSWKNRKRIAWAQKMVDYKPSRWGEFKRWLAKGRW